MSTAQGEAARILRDEIVSVGQGSHMRGAEGGSSPGLIQMLFLGPPRPPPKKKGILDLQDLNKHLKFYRFRMTG